MNAAANTLPQPQATGGPQDAAATPNQGPETKRLVPRVALMNVADPAEVRRAEGLERQLQRRRPYLHA
ncbi:hypothetical protein ARMGADRAFT_1010954 [Armillaria gallica]|uniref:Uncharacterized protein n=1 Tax=Armillaria gallica TaxID=47427 RepID=A0A2H3DQ94_ARMGA|nr:hypothetical protein ARMGADRAFT_1010954 [Armillaria gallica]